MDKLSVSIDDMTMKKKNENEIEGEYWVKLPSKEYTELLIRAAKTNMPTKQWRKEIRELAKEVLDKECEHSRNDYEKDY